MGLSFITPDWPAPPRVKALQSTRLGGVSEGHYAGLNLALHVGDDPTSVVANRERLRAHLPSEPRWLKQTHGTQVAVLTPALERASLEADAAYTRHSNVVCAVQTADCLPILLCDREATVVAAEHAGWRSLCAGLIEATLRKLSMPPDSILAWLGPAIGPTAFEVGGEVYKAFVDAKTEAASAFMVAHPSSRKYLADLYALARQRLRNAGITAIYGGNFCTYKDEERFYSYRRNGVTGRMASLIWLE